MQFIEFETISKEKIALNKNKIQYFKEIDEGLKVVLEDDSFFIAKESFKKFLGKCNAIIISAKDCNGGFLL